MKRVLFVYTRINGVEKVSLDAVAVIKASKNNKSKQGRK